MNNTGMKCTVRIKDTLSAAFLPLKLLPNPQTSLMYITKKQLIFMILIPFIRLHYFFNYRHFILASDSIITHFLIRKAAKHIQLPLLLPTYMHK
uniref:Uncharacterized protein n=1 Tax=Lepeophtheirus salmonis TaxID=72036 RepID=A0A0K2V553_LEPSM